LSVEPRAMLRLGARQWLTHVSYSGSLLHGGIASPKPMNRNLGRSQSLDSYPIPPIGRCALVVRRGRSRPARAAMLWKGFQFVYLKVPLLHACLGRRVAATTLSPGRRRAWADADVGRIDPRLKRVVRGRSTDLLESWTLPLSPGRRRARVATAMCVARGALGGCRCKLQAGGQCKGVSPLALGSVLNVHPNFPRGLLGSNKVR
jgi:hypothetical protein